ncbi:ATP synthase subunit C lysine N-methyltransferase isoform X3 [Latimeria chalumnae]|uniref:ATP synthase subunit C lysine N-methyltransferase isoform X3 n=1 Tax=Latimeria chalumnae TaxID=7897 RepID=UPI00313E60D7
MSNLVQEDSFPQVDMEPNSCSECVKKKRWGLIVTGAVGGALVALYAVAVPFVTPALRKICLPFVPATSAQVENVLKMLQSRTGSVVDIGSGDGRIVIAAAKQGFQAVGYELNPWLVWYSRYKAWREGVRSHVQNGLPARGLDGSGELSLRMWSLLPPSLESSPDAMFRTKT